MQDNGLLGDEQAWGDGKSEHQGDVGQWHGLN